MLCVHVQLKATQICAVAAAAHAEQMHSQALAGAIRKHGQLTTHQALHK